jgi:hypothetical protein
MNKTKFGIKRFLFLTLFAASTQIHAQGLTPLLKEGSTNSNMKIFTVAIMNPYNQRMTYEMLAIDKETNEDQTDIKFSGRKGTIPRFGQKKIRVYIPIDQEDREARICVTFPEMQGTIRPRVCGDFTVRRANR